MMLAAAPTLAAAGVGVLGAVFGAGCDGELTPAEVLDRLREVDAAGGSLGDSVLDEPTLERLARAVRAIPTEASAMALRCALGGTGVTAIRGGRRAVRLTPEGGRLFFFDPAAAMASAARLARAVRDAASMTEADDLLAGMGIRTELAYERDAAAAG
jgi:hypothetical protein